MACEVTVRRLQVAQHHFGQIRHRNTSQDLADMDISQSGLVSLLESQLEFVEL